MGLQRLGAVLARIVLQLYRHAAGYNLTAASP